YQALSHALTGRATTALPRQSHFLTREHIKQHGPDTKLNARLQAFARHPCMTALLNRQAVRVSFDPKLPRGKQVVFKRHNLLRSVNNQSGSRAEFLGSLMELDHHAPIWSKFTDSDNSFGTDLLNANIAG